ncbi:MAG: hypothetical protein IT319_10375 [Anaerolineae bacterium]|nr:hypothetical protein [Anaerolineae bacterium]
MKQIAVLTGNMGSGKTTVCLKFAAYALRKRFDCAGVICPARYDGTRKVGIDLLDVRTQERRPLAEADDQPAPLRTGRYRFDTAAMAWGAACLESACPCDVLFVDELGPLELTRGKGWVNALAVLRDAPYRLAVVVVRPSLVDAFSEAMAGADVSLLPLHKRNDDDRIDDLLALLR